MEEKVSADIQKIYQYFLNQTFDIDIKKLRSVFASEGYCGGKKDAVVSVNDFLSVQIQKQQLDYIVKLSKVFPAEVLFMKGILLGNDLYGNLYFRKSKDLDILVKEKNIEKIGLYLLSEGFHCDIRFEEWLYEIQKNHLIFIKYISKGFPVVIELHSKVFNPPKFYEQYTEDVWKRAVYREILGFKTLVMDEYDRVIQYMLHYYIHCDELENFSMLGIQNSVKIKCLLDMYYMIKKYNVDFEIIWNRVLEIGAGIEFLEILQFLQNVFGDVCSPLFLQKIEMQKKNLEKADHGFWRSKISLGMALNNFFSKQYVLWNERFIDYDYQRTQNLSLAEKIIFKYSDEKVEFFATGNCVNDLKIKFDFEIKETINLEEFSVWIYYHIHDKLQNIYFHRLELHFRKESEEYVCRVLDSNSQQIEKIKHMLRNEGRRYYLEFEVPYEWIGRNLVTYSVNFTYPSKKYICVSGEGRMDFTTMRHIKIECD